MSATADKPNRPESPWVWHWVVPFGHSTALASVAAGPVSLLAGFSLAALVANLVEIDQVTRSTWDDLSAVFLAVGVASLLIALRLLLLAQQWAITPSQILELYPEARDSVRQLDNARQLQRRHLVLYIGYRERAEKWVPIGISAAVLGLALLAAGRVNRDHVLVLAVVVVLSISVLVSLLELARERPWFLFPDLRRWDQIRTRRANEKSKRPRATIYELTAEDFEAGSSQRAEELLLIERADDSPTAVSEVIRTSIEMGNSEAFANVLEVLLPRCYDFTVCLAPPSVRAVVDEARGLTVTVRLSPSMSNRPEFVFIEYDGAIKSQFSAEDFSTAGLYETAESVRGYVRTAAHLGGLLLLPTQDSNPCTARREALLRALGRQPMLIDSPSLETTH